MSDGIKANTVLGGPVLTNWQVARDAYDGKTGIAADIVAVLDKLAQGGLNTWVGFPDDTSSSLSDADFLARLQKISAAQDAGKIPPATEEGHHDAIERAFATTTNPPVPGIPPHLDLSLDGYNIQQNGASAATGPRTVASNWEEAYDALRKEKTAQQEKAKIGAVMQSAEDHNRVIRACDEGMKILEALAEKKVNAWVGFERNAAGNIETDAFVSSLRKLQAHVEQNTVPSAGEAPADYVAFVAAGLGLRRTPDETTVNMVVGSDPKKVADLAARVSMLDPETPAVQQVGLFRRAATAMGAVVTGVTQRLVAPFTSKPAAAPAEEIIELVDIAEDRPAVTPETEPKLGVNLSRRGSVLASAETPVPTEQGSSEGTNEGAGEAGTGDTTTAAAVEPVAPVEMAVPVAAVVADTATMTRAQKRKAERQNKKAKKNDQKAASNKAAEPAAQEAAPQLPGTAPLDLPSNDTATTETPKAAGPNKAIAAAKTIIFSLPAALWQNRAAIGSALKNMPKNLWKNRKDIAQQAWVNRRSILAGVAGGFVGRGAAVTVFGLSAVHATLPLLIGGALGGAGSAGLRTASQNRSRRKSREAMRVVTKQEYFKSANAPLVNPNAFVVKDGVRVVTKKKGLRNKVKLNLIRDQFKGDDSIKQAMIKGALFGALGGTFGGFLYKKVVSVATSVWLNDTFGPDLSSWNLFAPKKIGAGAALANATGPVANPDFTPKTQIGSIVQHNANVPNVASTPAAAPVETVTHTPSSASNATIPSSVRAPVEAPRVPEPEEVARAASAARATAPQVQAPAKTPDAAELARAAQATQVQTPAAQAPAAPVKNPDAEALARAAQSNAVHQPTASGKGVTPAKAPSVPKASVTEADELARAARQTGHKAPTAHETVQKALKEAKEMVTSRVALKVPVPTGMEGLVNDEMMAKLPRSMRHLAKSGKPEDMVKFCKEVSHHLQYGKGHTKASAALGDKIIEYGAKYAQGHNIDTRAAKQLFADYSYAKAWGKGGLGKDLAEAASFADKSGGVMHNYRARFFKLFPKLKPTHG